jgi:DNA repair protein RadC
MLEMGYLTQEQLRVLCLDTKNFVVVQPKPVYAAGTAGQTSQPA